MSDTKNLKDLREKRGIAIAAARAVSDKAAAEKRGMTAEEQSIYDNAWAEQEALGKTIQAQERQIELDKELATQQDAEARARETTQGGSDGDQRAQKHLAAFRKYLTGRIGTEAYQNEVRSLQNDSDAAGGYLTLPLQLQNDIIVPLKDLVFVRAGATVIPVTSADALGCPTLSADPADADWTNELSTGSEDSTMAFGRRDLKPHPTAKRIKISGKLLRVAALNPESLVMDRFTYKFAVTEEKAFLTGSGANQPLGLFTASAAGIDTSRDVSCALTTAIGADDLISTKYSVKAQYRPGSGWIFNRTGVKQVAKLKDGEGQYLWQAGLQAGSPDRILGDPVKESEYAPSTFTTGKYVGLYGNLKYYYIADALTMTVQRLNELYAESAQIGFIMRKETDGMPVLAEAFARMKLA